MKAEKGDMTRTSPDALRVKTSGFAGAASAVVAISFSFGLIEHLMVGFVP
jgi:hypothetical protein